MKSINAAKPDLSYRRMGLNVIMNVANLVVGMAIGLFVTPYWVKTLGVAAYGLVPLVGNLTTFLALVALVLNSSVARFITIAVGKQEHERAERIFNTTLMGALAIAGLMGVLGVGLSLAAPTLVRVPAGYEREIRLIVAVVVATLAVNTISLPFGTGAFCANRLDINTGLDFLYRVVNVGVGLALVATILPRPVALSLGGLVGTLMVAGMNYYFWRRFMPWMRMRRQFDWGIFREQAIYGGWAVVNQVGAILFLYVDLIVLNRMLGPVPAGQYAALLQWSVLLRAAGVAVSGVFQPMMLHIYARQDMEGLVVFTRRAVRIMGLLLTLPIVLVCGLSRPLLTVWIGPDFAPLAPLLVLMTLHLCVNLSVAPFFTLQQTTNHVRVPAILTCVMGLGNLGLAIFCTGPLGFGIYGVALAGAVVLTAKNALFSPWYGARILNQPRAIFAWDIARTAGLSVGLSALIFYVAGNVDLCSWVRLILAGACITVGYVIFAWVGLLSAAERTLILARVGLKKDSDSARS